MRALVTGATGFMGGRLTERLLERGDSVRVLARRPEAAARLVALGASVTQGDLTDVASLERAVADVDVVFHCAGLSVDWAPHAEFERVNVDGAIAMARAAAHAKVSRFVHVSSTDVYGYPVVPCGDDGPTLDVGLPYNSSKLRGELGVRAVAAETGLSLTVIRPGTVWGPRAKDWGVEMSKLLATKDMMVVAGGHVAGGLVFIDNLIDALVEAATRDEAKGRIYTVRDESKDTWRAYLDALADGLKLPRVSLSLPLWFALALGAVSEFFWKLVRAKSRPLVTRHAVYVLGRDQSYGIARAVAELGFTSRVSFAEGMQQTIAWLDSPEGRAARDVKLSPHSEAPVPPSPRRS